MSQSNSTTALILRELRTETGIVQVAQRPTDGYINLTHIAKAVGEQPAHWTDLQGTQRYLAAFETVNGIPLTELIQIVKGGFPELQGTWAHPQPALKFAAWCDPLFEVQVWAWIHELGTTGVVDIRAQSANPVQRALVSIGDTNTAIGQALQALSDNQEEQGCKIIQLYDEHRQLALRLDQEVAQVRDQIQYGLGQIEKREELRLRAARDRARRTAPKGHEMWWWRQSGGRCINPRCRIALDELSPRQTHNHPVYDEVIPVTDGGWRCIANTQLICHGCNSRKSAKWTDYRPAQLIAEAVAADAAGARHHADLRQRLSQQLGLFDALESSASL